MTDWRLRFAGKMASAHARHDAGEAALRDALGLPWLGGLGVGDWIWPVGGVRMKVCVRPFADPPPVVAAGDACDVCVLVWVCPDGQARMVAWVDADVLRSGGYVNRKGDTVLWSYARNHPRLDPTPESLRARLGLDAGMQIEMGLDGRALNLPDGHIAPTMLTGAVSEPEEAQHVDEQDERGGFAGRVPPREGGG